MPGFVKYAGGNKSWRSRAPERGLADYNMLATPAQRHDSESTHQRTLYAFKESDSRSAMRFPSEENSLESVK